MTLQSNQGQLVGHRIRGDTTGTARTSSLEGKDTERNMLIFKSRTKKWENISCEYPEERNRKETESGLASYMTL